ncbi:MAG: GH92 family glycosyl hydrolase [Cyclobacteriaceae bacterium]
MSPKFIKQLLPVLSLICVVNGAVANSYNIASKAQITSSSTLSDEFNHQNLTDGIIGVDGMGEWACKGETLFWGYIEYPWVKLEWPEEESINKVIIYDRSTLTEHLAGGILSFSDGSEIRVNAITNNGLAKVVEFPSKKTRWVKFLATDGDGKNLGLSEIEVFSSPEGYTDFVSWVDPFIETTRGRYFYFTPGSLPFGMVAAAPHTRNKNQWGGGYNYNTTEILGFGQIHGWMLSGISIMPTSADIDPTKGEQGWKSSFSHDDEIAQPGYQRIFLRDSKIWTEYSATERVSLYRFRFTKEMESAILINLGGYLGNSTMMGAQVTKVGENGLEGSFISAGRLWGGPKEVKVFFAAKFDQAFEQLDGWSDTELLANVNKLEGSKEMQRRDSAVYGDIVQSYYDAPGAGISAKYNFKAGDILQMKIAISYTSTENAWQNMESELDHWNFDKVRTDAQQTWNQWLGKIEVFGGTAQQKTKFYTDLWHVLLGRHRLNDVSGDYPDYTKGERDWKFTDAQLKVRTLPKNADGSVKFNMYNSDALWLTQWNLNVLWGLCWPGILDDFSASMVQYADNGGLLPRGACAGGYSYIMTGNPATNMLVSAYMKGMLTKTDPKHAFDVMKRNHLPGGMMGDTADELQFYIENGWCPGNAGKTIEWAFQDWALAQMAQKLGKKRDYNEFSRRAEGWKNLFDNETKLVFPKKENGDWLHKDELSGAGWIEANAWQGTWSLSHQISDLSEMIGGNDQTSEMLNFAFEQAEKDDFVFGYGSGYVSYANQPGCSNAHVFNYLGKPWLSQYWVRKVNEQAYGATSPDAGYGGHDEDQGQMGGVSALMSIGLFSLKGNTSTNPVYEITSPVFDRVVIHLDNQYYSGKQFEIITKNNSAENMYIQNASLDGNQLDGPWFLHEQLEDGGRLEIELGPEPNQNWGNDLSRAPR